MSQPRFEPTRQAALKQLSKVVPDAYAKSRNFVDGAVTYLSPWITHGFLDTREVATVLSRRYPLDFEHKMIFELGWREFFQHVHHELGDGIFRDVRRPMFHVRYAQQLPADLIEGRTGVQAIDEAVKLLYETGYLHNHMRMWLASYTVHLRKVHWKVGAEWMYSHLLDGDLASNHLSWQWVAATFSHKPYLFNAENVHKYARRLNCSNTVLDTDYVELGAMAASARDCGPERGAPSVGVIQPDVYGGPEADLMGGRRVDIVDEESARLALSGHKQLNWVHPWDLRRCTEAQAGGAVTNHATGHSTSVHRGSGHAAGDTVGLVVLPFHEAHPWSAKRWAFVMDCMLKHCSQVWVVNARGMDGLRRAFKAWNEAGGVAAFGDCLNPYYAEVASHWPVKVKSVETVLPRPSMFQQSFSRFYSKACAQAGSLEQALGLDEAMNSGVSGVLNSGRSEGASGERKMELGARRSQPLET